MTVAADSSAGLPPQRFSQARVPDPGFLTAIGHLYVVNGFVIAQPLLERLSSNARYIQSQGLSSACLILVCLSLILGLPTLLAVVEWLALRVHPRLQQGLHRAVIGLYALMQGGLVARWVVNFNALRFNGCIDFLQLALALPVAALLWWLYVSQAWARQLVTWAAPGLLIFPIAFLLAPAVNGILFPARTVEPVLIQHPTPIVLIVFDSLLGTAIMGEDGGIDAIRYPNFARLAEQADWFRQTTTVHPRTDHAIPALLTGRYPVDSTQPVLANYPRNLISLLHDSPEYDVTAFEPFTRLTPAELENRPRQRSLSRATWETLETLGRVYLKICLPENFATDKMPPVPRPWFSLPEASFDIATLRQGLIEYSWDRDRGTQLQHFLECLHSGGRPHFWFAHFAVPHHPLRYYPSGNSYQEELGYLPRMPGAHGVIGELWGPDQFAADQAWQRYLLQVGYTDHCLGRILDRLQETDLWERCLLVVTSDHGSSFQANQSMREPSAATLADLLPVALFIKRPGATAGRVLDRNVELIDVLPTIAAEIGMDLPEPVDGESVYSESRARLTKTLITQRGPLAIEGTFPQGDESRQRMLSRFGSGRDDRLWSLDVRNDLVGRKIDELLLAEGVRQLVVYQPSRRLTDPQTGERTIPGLLEGTLEESEQPTEPVVLAVVIDGRIATVTRTLADRKYAATWEVLLPESALAADASSYQLWEVLGNGESTRVRPCVIRLIRR